MGVSSCCTTPICPVFEGGLKWRLSPPVSGLLAPNDCHGMGRVHSQKGSPGDRGRNKEELVKTLALLVAILLSVSIAAAAGNEVQGKVKKWDAATQTITLEDGT